MSDQFFWYVTRSSALVSWVFAAFSILLGLMTSSRLLGRRPTIPWLVDLHRMLARLCVVFLLVHMISLWFDSFVQFRLAELLIPWYASIPGLSKTSLALGVIAAWLLAAVQVSSLFKEQIPDRWWRTTHQLSYATLILGAFHAVQAGSDVENPIVIAVGASLLTAITLLTLVRLYRLAETRLRGGGQGPARISTTKTGDVPAPERKDERQPVLSHTGPLGTSRSAAGPLSPDPGPLQPMSLSGQARRSDTGPIDRPQPQPTLFPDGPPPPAHNGPQPPGPGGQAPNRPLPPITHRPANPDQDPGTSTGRLPVSRSNPSETRPPEAPRPPRPQHRG